MKGFQPLFLGIFGIFAFSWLGMTVVPNLQIGSLNPQTDEDGGDVYPSPHVFQRKVADVRFHAAHGNRLRNEHHPRDGHLPDALIV